MSFAVTGVVCFAALAIVGPILLYVSALLLHRRIHRERQTSAIYRVQGLDPPLGTRDPALLWPSVLATPAVLAADKSQAAPTLVSSQDADDSVISRRPASVASSSSTASGGTSTQLGSVSRGSATHRALLGSTSAGCSAPPPAVSAGGCRSHAADKKSSSSSSSSDCCITLNDVNYSRDQIRRGRSWAPIASLELSTERAGVHVNTVSESHHLSADHRLPAHVAHSSEIAQHWGTPTGHGTSQINRCLPSSSRTDGLQAAVITPCGPSESLHEIVSSNRHHPGQQALCV